MADFDTLKAASRRPEASVSLCLRGDLFAEKQRLLREIRDLERNVATSNSLAGNPVLSSARARLDGLETEARDHTFVFTFRGLPGKDFRALEDEHPAGDEEAYSQEFLRELVVRTLSEPALTGEQIDELEFTDGQLQALENAALHVNRDVSLPFTVSA